MVWPYMALTPLLVWGFLRGNRAELNAYGVRLLLCTAWAGLVFAFWPVRNLFAPPAVQEGVCATLLTALRYWDQPFNQFPSLHVSYALVWGVHVWQGVAHRMLRWALCWFVVLVMASTVWTHQHHAPDVLGGLVLGMACLAWRGRPSAGVRVALVYALLAMWLISMGRSFQGLGWVIYPAMSCLAVCWMYTANQHAVLHKVQGQFRGWQWFVFGPYLLGYKLAWLAVVFNGRAQSPVRQIAPHVWVGRRLGWFERQRLDVPRLSVVDLSNELSETLLSERYRHFPWLDLTPAPNGLRQALLAYMAQNLQQGFVLYIHCAMGLDRSAQVALWWQEYANGQAEKPTDEAAKKAAGACEKFSKV